MRRLKKAAFIGLTSLLMPATAMAGKGNVHRDYASVGGAASAAVLDDNVKFAAGVDVARRFPLGKNVGLLLGYSLQLVPEKGVFNDFLGKSVLKGKLDISIDSVLENSEFYVGPGFWLHDREAYFAPQIGFKYHLGKKRGFYFSGEAGPLVKGNGCGAFVEFGVGYRWDSPLR